MNLAASALVAVAERVERTGGARAGLLAWKALASNTSAPELRGKALVAGLRCALTLRDGDAIDELTAAWANAQGGVWDEAVTELALGMAATGLLPRAVALARAEALRHRTARSLYLHARCLDVARDPATEAVFGEVVVRAEREGARDLALAARVRRASLLAQSWSTMGEALGEAQQVDPSAVTPASRLALAGVLLRSPSRFTRATALGLLDDLVMLGDEQLASRALDLAARWADDAGELVTPLEADRLRALFGREIARRLAPGAEAVLRGGPLPAKLSSRWVELLDVVAALRNGATARAAHGLRGLADVEPFPPVILGLARTALAHDDAELREAAAEVVARRLSRVAVGAPPRGWLDLAEALVVAGKPDLALVARHAAAVAKERGAADSLATLVAREGWELARAGDRQAAITKLREAKKLQSACK